MPLSVAHGPEAWIDDFVHSTAPQFQGKSKKKRIQMALAAFYAKKRESALLINAHTLLELGMPDQSKPPQSNYVTGGTKTNPGMSKNSLIASSTSSAPSGRQRSRSSINTTMRRFSSLPTNSAKASCKALKLA